MPRMRKGPPERLRLCPTGAAALEARSWMRELGLPLDVLDDALLVASELVTNSVRHATFAAEEWICLEISLDAAVMRIEVSDPGPGIGAGARAMRPPQQPGGRGLSLVEALSARWGASREGYASVWAELPRPFPLP